MGHAGVEGAGRVELAAGSDADDFRAGFGAEGEPEEEACGGEG